MKPAQSHLQRIADIIILHESNLNPDRCKVARVPHLGKKASYVTDAPRHDDLHFRQFCIDYFHRPSRTRLHSDLLARQGARFPAPLPLVFVGQHQPGKGHGERRADDRHQDQRREDVGRNDPGIQEDRQHDQFHQAFGLQQGPEPQGEWP